MCRLIHKWGAVSTCAFTYHEEREMLELATGLLHFFRHSVDSFLVAAIAEDQTIMMVYISDGWGGSVFETTVAKSSTGASIQRASRVRKEWALERGVFKTIDLNDEISGRIMSREASKNF